MPKAPKKEPPDLSPLLNGNDVCQSLGISSRTLDRLIADGELPPDYRIRGRNRWKASTLVESRDSQRTKPKEAAV